MSKLQQFRQQNPAYANTPDNVLADALHKKYYSNIDRSQFDNKLGISASSSSPRKGSTFVEENIERPLLKAGKSVAAMGAGLADVANLAVEAPLYAGNRIASYANRAMTGEPVQPYKPVFAKTDLAQATRQGIDEATGGLTSNRNQAERGLEIGQEIASGLISPTAAVKGAQSLGRGVLDLTKQGIKKATGVKDDLIGAFDSAGISPRLADVSTSKPVKAYQNLLEVFPGSASKIQNATENQVRQIENQLAGLTKSKGGTMQEAGKEIQQGATQFKEFVGQRVGKLYDDLDKYLPNKEKTTIPVKNYLNITRDPQVQDIAAVGAGDTARVLKRAESILDESGNISYPRLKSFRTVIGSKLQSPSLLGDERLALKKIYGALSTDMKEAVVANGGAKGLQAFNKANNAFSRSQDLFEKSINPLIDAKTPEAVYQMALSGSKQGGSNIKPIMNALDPSQKDFVRGTIVKKMGLQNPGQQDAAGEIFSPNKFLTEWNKLSPEARRNIFNPDQIKSINNLNKAISNIKETSKIANKSNNIPALSWLGLGGAVLASPLSAGQAMAGIGSARISAEMFANPNFIKWLSKAPTVKSQELPKYISQLSTIAAANPAISSDILEYLESITISDANAAENFSEDELRQMMIAQNQQIPNSYTEQEIENNPKVIKDRFYRENTSTINENLSEEQIRNMMIEQNSKIPNSYTSQQIEEYPRVIKNRYYRN